MVDIFDQVDWISLLHKLEIKDYEKKWQKYN